MPKNQLTKKNEAYLTLEINEKNYNIPLASSMKLKELRKLTKIEKLPETDQLDAIAEFFAKYLGESVVDDLSVADLYEILKYWKEANSKTGGLSLGES